MSKSQVTVVFDKIAGCTIYELAVNVNGKDFCIREHVYQYSMMSRGVPHTDLLSDMQRKLGQTVIESLVRIEA